DVDPVGAPRPVVTTRALASATPVAGAEPVPLVLGTSSLPERTRPLLLAEAGVDPVGAAADAAGADTTDPETILDGGGIRPFGGHKGAMLSFMIETLAAGLTGGAFTFEIDAEAPEGVHTFRTGQLYIVIDPERGGNEAYLTRVR